MRVILRASARAKLERAAGRAAGLEVAHGPPRNPDHHMTSIEPAPGPSVVLYSGGRSGRHRGAQEKKARHSRRVKRPGAEPAARL